MKPDWCDRAWLGRPVPSAFATCPTIGVSITWFTEYLPGCVQPCPSSALNEAIACALRNLSGTQVTFVLSVATLNAIIFSTKPLPSLRLRATLQCSLSSRSQAGAAHILCQSMAPLGQTSFSELISVGNPEMLATLQAIHKTWASLN